MRSSPSLSSGQIRPSYFGSAVAVAAGLAVVTWASVAAGEPFVYRDMCEASAAVALGTDHFVAASDESNVLRIYKRGEPNAVALANVQGFTDFDKSDLEGAAALEGTIFWISSHSLNTSGGDRKRKILFATVPSGTADAPSIRADGKVFGELRDPLRDLLDGVIEDEVTNGDINIEGLAAGPNQSLHIGLREPLHGTHALIVRLNNPFELVAVPPEGKLPVPDFSEPIELELGGLGIRSLELVVTGPRSYLIAAGPTSDDGGFALYWWDGLTDAVERIEPFDFEGIKPEAMFATGTGSIQFLGDNGSRDCDEEEMDQDDWWFPSIEAAL